MPCSPVAANTGERKMSNHNTVQITPIPGCRNCNGSGEVVDYVPYGNTHVPMPSICDYVSEQVPEDKWDWEIELVWASEPDPLINKH